MAILPSIVPLVSLPEPVSLYAGLVVQATVGAGSRGMYAGPAARRELGHLCKATPTAIAFTPRCDPLQRKLSHHLEPGSSWEGDETLAEVVAKTTPTACARSSQSRQDGKAQLAQSTFRACQVPCGCAQRRLRKASGISCCIQDGKGTETGCPALS